MLPGKKGGTWLGMSKNGKIGVLTFYRESLKLKRESERGRGHLVADFLKSSQQTTPLVFLENVRKTSCEYGGFNLILGHVPVGSSDMDFAYYCNREHKPLFDLKAGTYGLSNRYLNYGWEKVVVGKQSFNEIVQRQCTNDEKITQLLTFLSDETRSVQLFFL